MLSGAGDPHGHLVEGADGPQGGHVDGRAAHGAWISPRSWTMKARNSPAGTVPAS
jgi:hypothetical protein